MINDYITNDNNIRSYKSDNYFNRIEFQLDLIVNHPNATILSGKEFEDFINRLNIKQTDGLEIIKESKDINGVRFDTFEVVDMDKVKIKEFNDFINDSNKVLSNVNKDVLEFVNNNKTKLIYCSNPEVAGISENVGGSAGGGHTIENASHFFYSF